jgi:hypothetical protein
MLPLSMLPVLAGTEAKGKHLKKRNERKKSLFVFNASLPFCLLLFGIQEKTILRSGNRLIKIGRRKERNS